RSAGLPVAKQRILKQLPPNFPHPILIIQHLPAAFTQAFAGRLDSFCKIKVQEAKNGDRVVPGVSYLAPGGQQMRVEARGGSKSLVVFE
ncbi:chemotaxis response regulator protein-glutamate methylesterase, partial [Pseudoalteromonas citrea]